MRATPRHPVPAAVLLVVSTGRPGVRARAREIFAHDFDGDGKDELYWHDQVGSIDRIWSFDLGGGGDQYQETTIAAAHPQHQERLPVTGNFHPNGSGVEAPRAEIYWWNPLGSSELWVLDVVDEFQPEVAPSGQGFPVGYALR